MMKSIVDSSYDGIYVTDGEANTLLVNKSYGRITGLNIEELIGKNMKDLVEAGVYDNSGSLTVIETGKEATVNQKLSSGKEILVTSVPVFDENGAIKYIVTNVRDLSEMERLRRELFLNQNLTQKYKDELENMKEQLVDIDDITFRDKSMFNTLKMILKISKMDTSVLLTGETGTGKTHIAKLIHKYSNRNEKTFIEINCGAIPESLIESEFFGYEAGAFTGASKKGKMGVFELANNSTLFLDEISEIPYHLQNKFLRVLQEKCFRRVGGEETIYVDVRVVAATNKNLSLLCDEGKFRTDLFYRLNVLEIETIPLRKRKEDIFIIGKHILEKELLGLNLFEAERFTNILEKLSEYPFPGNVRELENIVKRVVVLKINLKLSDDKILSLLPLGKIEKKKNEFLNMTLREIERKIITEVLEEEDNNKTKTAIRLGIDRGTLNRILKEK